ncbi:hypothetical protein [Psychrobacillus sp. OK028]|uniref:hypothetical protein n=1 Tax=Psychrobacillus sp. OK028 TaxID=1884359 RepID=UPI000B81FF7E|nr:hypothetical protein [Psychrobacillus sp. OK028]
MGDLTIDITNRGITRLGKIKYKGEDGGSVGQVICTFEVGTGRLTSKSLLADVHPLDSPIGEKVLFQIIQ